MNGEAVKGPVPDTLKLDILKGLWQWNTVLTSSSEIEKWNAYFHYYTTECQNTIRFQRGTYTFVREHKDITEIAKQLEDCVSKEEIKQSLFSLDTQQRSEERKGQMAEGSVRLVARLVSMVDIGPIPHGLQGRPPLPWDNERSDLKSFLANYFEKSSTDSGSIKFGDDFTALNLRRIAGIEIYWTNNLADHLRMIDNDTKLCIFHHATFLKWHNRCVPPDDSLRQRWLTVPSNIFPDGLAKETLQTLALLFPRNDRQTQIWMSSEFKTFKDTVYLDLELLNCDRVMSEDRRAEKFKFWRDELLTLEEKLENPRFTSIKQFWYDRRNKVQWYTFWIAVLILCLTIFFGLVQNIEGALQVYKAYHPTRN